MPEADLNVAENLLQFSFNIAKTKDAGEDADPVLLNEGGCFYLSVCDGLGGAGSTMYDEQGTLRSGAYIASRLVNQRSAGFFSKLLRKSASIAAYDIDQFNRDIAATLKNKMNELRKGEKSLLKSKLLKDLPTTFSGLYITKDKQLDLHQVYSIWAGDSRNYALTTRDGLQQLSIDELKQEYDPLENLIRDSPLKNFISAEGGFEINCRRTDITAPLIVLTATDGCFGYYNTPMQFELVLLTSMQKSSSMEEWEQELSRMIGEVAGDDFSMALLALGYDSYDLMKQNFLERKDLVDKLCEELFYDDRQLKTLIEEKNALEANLKSMEEKRSANQKEVWEKYKPLYLHRINNK